MKTYSLDMAGTVTLPRRGSVAKGRLRIFATFACVFFVGSFCSNAFLASYSSHDSLVALAVHSAIVAILAGGSTAFFYKLQMNAVLRRLMLNVDDDSLTAKWSDIPWSQSVHKGKVRTIFAIKGLNGHTGIGVSERSRFGARMMGFVFLPEALPEYESLKALVESWRIPNSAA